MKPSKLVFPLRPWTVRRWGASPRYSWGQVTCSLPGCQDWGWWKETLWAGQADQEGLVSCLPGSRDSWKGFRCVWSLNTLEFVSYLLMSKNS